MQNRNSSSKGRAIGPVDRWLLKTMGTVCLSYQINWHKIWIKSDDGDDKKNTTIDLTYYNSLDAEYNVSEDGIAAVVIAHSIYFAPKEILYPIIMMDRTIKKKSPNNLLYVCMSPDTELFNESENKKWGALMKLLKKDYSKPYGDVDETFMDLLAESVSYPYETFLGIDYFDGENLAKQLSVDMRIYEPYEGKYNVKDGVAAACINGKVYFAPANIIMPILMLKGDLVEDSEMPVYLSNDMFPSEQFEGNKWAVLLILSKNLTDVQNNEFPPKKETKKEETNLPKKDSE